MSTCIHTIHTYITRYMYVLNITDCQSLKSLKWSAESSEKSAADIELNSIRLNRGAAVGKAPGPGAAVGKAPGPMYIATSKRAALPNVLAVAAVAAVAAVPMNTLTGLSSSVA